MRRFSALLLPRGGDVRAEFLQSRIWRPPPRAILLLTEQPEYSGLQVLQVRQEIPNAIF